MHRSALPQERDTYSIAIGFSRLLVKVVEFHPFKRIWDEKGSEIMLKHVYLLTANSYGTDGAIFRLSFRRESLVWFFQTLTVGY